MIRYIASFKVGLILLYIIFFAKISAVEAQGVFVVDEVYKADTVVYLTEYKYEADLNVYKTKYQYQHNFKNGIWYFLDASLQASQKIYFTDRKYEADLIIYFVDERYQAGKGE